MMVTSDIDFENLANMFLSRYKDWVVDQVKDSSDTARFQRLLRDNNFAKELCGLSNRLCYVYENPEWHSSVLETLDLDVIYGNVDSQVKSDSDKEYTDILVKELLRYFKQDFFKWVNQPDCQRCGSDVVQSQSAIGIQGPTPEERRFECGSVEVYKCNNCGNITRFPRYNNPIKLLETRQGRCGEFANLFTLILKSFGLETRYIWNKEDHVWCEYYSTNLNRWVHVDPSEQSFDQPYIYSINWNKKMSYCVAFNNEGVTDVSKRYILQNELPRDKVSETELYFLCQSLTKKQRADLSPNQIYDLEMRDERERISWIENVKKEEEPSETEKQGRVSGSAEWKAQRGENGK
ncbi:hypothetical protein Kpol_1074p3 [Vanderwaltozyma polyspora DSM 70294]|uniref:Peptide-N(4)-(N-acetyl-beta-glucosaminyl)asparagine amidase n=1 Tax=Vanderwaltozyma polyspora (strain ATCC 22028 / DSM 70294 / BCRC 21397 / CBS 2163 / NBRC 10782 / NRRL Y-8283 / UCD 57-17) TaxID=436907 RepID=A7TTQ7_VANPO|nr:uncharacterized protein Kpol_1074p3 [Vanderwaltozyma polyspora DSM 70294]EDO14350.1 hypothetical protein Kpol_1074p3 [Vanderwaltozyma polyspora DSM 70294]